MRRIGLVGALLVLVACDGTASGRAYGPIDATAPGSSLPTPPVLDFDPVQFDWYDWTLTNALDGLDLDDVVRRLERLGWTVRVFDLDGSLAATLDLNHARVNVYHRHGLVTEVFVG